MTATINIEALWDQRYRDASQPFPIDGAGGSVATDSIFQAKGDLVAATGNAAATRIPIGANGKVLTADSTQAAGAAWKDAASTFARDVTKSPYNAVGDGITDDTAAIQAAFNDGGVVYIPPGKIFKTGKLTATPGLVVRGGQGGFLSLPESLCSVIKLANGVNDDLILVPAGAYNVNLFDLRLDGNKAGQASGTGAVVNLADYATAYEQTQFKLTRCFVRSGYGYGVRVGTHRGGTKIIQSTIYSNSNAVDQNEGIRIQAADCMVKFCSIGANGGAGITCGNDIGQVLMNGIWGNNWGISVSSTIAGWTIAMNGIDTNNREGILVNANADAININGNIFHTNSFTVAGRAHMYVKSTKGTISMLGNHSAPLDSGFTNTPTYLIFMDDSVTVQGWGNTVSAGSAGGLSNDVSRVTSVFNNTGSDAAKPGVHTTAAGTIYLSNDVANGTAYISDGSAWTQLAPAKKHGDTHLTGGGDAITWGSVALDSLGSATGNINFNGHNAAAVGAVVINGLTGATAGCRFVGATTSGAPISGAFITGDFVICQNGHIAICTSGGSPGTWVVI